MSSKQLGQQLANRIGTFFVFSDGACSGNPGPGGWAFVLVDLDKGVIERSGRAGATTNNQMEMTAALEGLRTAGDLIFKNRIPSGEAEIVIFTDSQYLIQGMTQWIHNWKRRGFVTQAGKEVLNQTLWRSLDEAVSRLGKKFPVQWRYVPGHSGHPVNERVDQLAVAMSRGESIEHFSGRLSGYAPVSSYEQLEKWKSEDQTVLKSQKPASAHRAKQKAYSYLSLLGGKLERHKTWIECQKRVTGQSGAKFIKTISPEDEANILKQWGF